MADTAPIEEKRYKDITFKSEDDPPPWSEIQDPEYGSKPPWAPRKLPVAPDRREDSGRLPAQHGPRDFPREEAGRSAVTPVEKKEKAEGASWIAKLRRWVCARKRREAEAVSTDELSHGLLRDPETGDEESRARRITPSSYNAMEIHGFFGLVDDGPSGEGRMLIVHQPSWVRGQFLDIKDGDDIHVWHVAGRAGGVLRVLSAGRHRYYSPGQRVTTCTVCVPEEQWERLMQ